MAELSRSLIDAANFAALKHSTQRRKDPDATPYINHPIGVAHILCVEGLVCDPVVLQAALLHDTVEDTATTPDEIEQRFGAHVRAVVEEVTDDKSLSSIERKLRQVQNAALWSYQAKLVCLADKLYNVRDAVRQTPFPELI
ncbi:unnamed protein product [Soboliphyme baturini]|uniref:Guanosine-3',5'-bis(diphosphate) 3'-pyrophosphohydrolase MESH1 n=1 Tax=Soboliphyme baturini TaxID=241478 RepID=A0A183INA3_9BILA|nr:unnamed protein product [Soboliphyme baturini]